MTGRDRPVHPGGGDPMDHRDPMDRPGPAERRDAAGHRAPADRGPAARGEPTSDSGELPARTGETPPAPRQVPSDDGEMTPSGSEVPQPGGDVSSPGAPGEVPRHAGDMSPSPYEHPPRPRELPLLGAGGGCCSGDPAWPVPVGALDDLDPYQDPDGDAFEDADDEDGLGEEIDGDDDELPYGDDEIDLDALEEELRRAASVMDPVPPGLRRAAVEAFALVDLDAKIAELSFDSLMEGAAVRSEGAEPRMLTFEAGGLTVDVEVMGGELIGQVLPPQQARVEVLSGPRTAIPLSTDARGRFRCDGLVTGPFALRLTPADGEAVVTGWTTV